jgi:hypothetical protein
MEAILKFNLPEDQTEFHLATQGSDWWSVAWDMDQWLRSNTKYAPDSMSTDTYNAYQKCREELREIINNKGLLLNLD